MIGFLAKMEETPNTLYILAVDRDNAVVRGKRRERTNMGGPESDRIGHPRDESGEERADGISRSLNADSMRL